MGQKYVLPSLKEGLQTVLAAKSHHRDTSLSAVDALKAFCPESI